MFTKESRILICDDAKSMQTYVQKKLSELGYENVVKTSSGNQAWEVVEKGLSEGAPIDLICSDFNMPDGDGLSLLTRLRTDPRTFGVPFIMVTVNTLDEADMGELTKGCFGYIKKPFSAQKLATELTRVWDEMPKAS